MNTPNSWLKKIYLCKKNSVTIDDYSQEVITYDTPIQYYINHQPISASSDLQMYGQRSLQIQGAILDKDSFNGVFNEFDLVYLDGASPRTKPSWDNDTTGTKEPVNGYWANYRVVSIRIQNKSIVVYFEKIDSK